MGEPGIEKGEEEAQEDSTAGHLLISVFGIEVVLHVVHEFGKNAFQFGALVRTHRIQNDPLEIGEVLKRANGKHIWHGAIRGE